MPGPWAKIIRHAHVELINADRTFSAWMSGLVPLISTWTLSERKRALALATSNKVYLLPSDHFGFDNTTNWLGGRI